ncbi:UDP-glucose 4-epimerase [Luteolibacter sp. LG18]|nr:UDP-glucose 4-epimerase [Luteolibacter sp. LG18]
MAAGHELTILAREGGREVPSDVERLAAPVGEWVSAVGSRSYDVCIHLAWIATPGVYLHSEENEIFADVTLALAEVLFRNGLRYFVGTGTCIEYSPDQSEICVEDVTPTEPIHPYSLAKDRTRRGLEQLSVDAEAEFTWARVFYPYGPGEHPARTISSFLRELRSHRTVTLRNPGSVKDFIHVRDVATAFLKVAEGSAPRGVVNIGTGRGISIREIALRAAAATGADASLITAVGDPPYDPYGWHVADIRKLSATGWRPEIDIDTGIRQILEVLR